MEICRRIPMDSLTGSNKEIRRDICDGELEGDLGDWDGDLLADFNGLFHRLLEGDADGLKSMVSLMKGCCRWIEVYCDVDFGKVSSKDLYLVKYFFGWFLLGI
jgi:hypothetical protein